MDNDDDDNDNDDDDDDNNNNNSNNNNNNIQFLYSAAISVASARCTEFTVNYSKRLKNLHTRLLN